MSHLQTKHISLLSHLQVSGRSADLGWVQLGLVPRCKVHEGLFCRTANVLQPVGYLDHVVFLAGSEVQTDKAQLLKQDSSLCFFPSASQCLTQVTHTQGASKSAGPLAGGAGKSHDNSPGYKKEKGNGDTSALYQCLTNKTRKKFSTISNQVQSLNG